MDEIASRMVDALQVEEKGEYRRAAHLCTQLGKDSHARHGRFDPRALDAFEGVARSIRKGTDCPGRSSAWQQDRPCRPSSRSSNGHDQVTFA